MRGTMRAYCLTCHAGYGCEHSGACCTAGWPIPVEVDRVARLREHGLLPHADDAYLTVLEQPVDGLSLGVGVDPAGACVFFEKDRGRLCAIHRRAGAGLLPVACRNFPRIALHDPRGLFITLSHFCPTAARHLLHAGDIAVTDAPESLSLGGSVEGLNARSVMPPLLRPGMLMDSNGYSEWEHQALAALDTEDYPARTALAVIRRATSEACQWRPGGDPLAACVAKAFERAHLTDGRRPAAHGPLERPIKAFLAAHLFASWAAYQDGGPWGILRAVDAAYAMVGPRVTDEASFIAAVRDADLRLRHQGDHVGSEPVPARRRH